MTTRYLVLFSCLLIGSGIFAQPDATSKVVIVPCQSGDLFIDGNLIGPVLADDASQQTLAAGQHYLQLKSGTQKFNVTVTAGSAEIIKLGCSDEKSATHTTLLVDKQLNLSGALGAEVEQDAVALDKGDEVQISCAVLNKKGTATLWINSYPSGTEIFRKEQFNSLQENVVIAAKGIYVLRVTTNAFFGKDIKLTVTRKPAPKSNPQFNTAVKIVQDTLATEVLNTTARVYSTTNGNGNKTPIKINLPANTTYWTYWLGVGQESREKMKSFIAGLAGPAKLLSLNPLVLFGLNIIPQLPIMNATSTVNYCFMDDSNAILYQGNQQSHYFTFKYANNVSADYGLIKTVPASVVLMLTNNSSFTGQDTEVRVVAFSVQQKWVMQE